MLAAVMAAVATKVTAALPAAVLYTGPDAGDDRTSQALAIVIGDDGNPDSDAAATEDVEPASMGGTDRYRRGTIPCVLASWSGDTDMPSRLTEMDTCLDAIAQALAADPVLGGLVLSATFAGTSAVPLQTPSGATALAQWTVTYIGQTAY